MKPPGGSRRSRSRFGYPDMNPATLLFICQELRRVRTKHPTRDKNWLLIHHYQAQLSSCLRLYEAGGSSAAEIFTTGLQIAVMAIRLVEEGIPGNPYRGNAPDIGGPLGDYAPERTPADANSDPWPSDFAALDALTERFTRK